MVTQVELGAYLDEIREQVCSRCVERPPGGPPCEPQGKLCGVELHLPELIESIHDVHSASIAPYLEHNRADICEQCALYHSSICPCPMDYLSTLIVEAVERVDRRRDQRDHANRLMDSLADQGEFELAEIEEAYEEATGAWTGCDWPTHFGPEGLNLDGMTSLQAQAIAEDASDAGRAEAWRKAARWLGEVERYAAKADGEAAMAVASAKAGEWRAALQHARRAWLWEFATGRSLRRKGPSAWRNLALIMDHAARANETADVGGGD
jgi:hypothetical protein